MDIVFIVLILFFAATFIVTESGSVVVSPSGMPPAEAKIARPPIVVKIDSSGLITIDGRLHERAVIRKKLENIRAKRPDAPMNIAVHPDADSEALAAVIDAAREAGIESVVVDSGEES
jgi:biopolymer transport protein ExbD